MPYSILCCLHGIQLHGIRTFFRLGWPSPQVEESGLKSKNLKTPRGDLGALERCDGFNMTHLKVASF